MEVPEIADFRTQTDAQSRDRQGAGVYVKRAVGFQPTRMCIGATLSQYASPRGLEAHGSMILELRSESYSAFLAASSTGA